MIGSARVINFTLWFTFVPISFKNLIGNCNIIIYSHIWITEMFLLHLQFPSAAIIFFTLFFPLPSTLLFSHWIVSDSATPWTAAYQSSLSLPIFQSLLKLMSIESVMPSSHLILSHPLLLLPSVFPDIRVFSNESVLHIRWPKYWSFSFSSSPTNEYSGLIPFRIDLCDLLAVQGTLKNLHSVNHLRYATYFCYCITRSQLVTPSTQSPLAYRLKRKGISLLC